MTCNTAIEYGDQDEWTPYIAFPLHNAKEIFLSYPMKRKPRDQILWKNGCCECASPVNGLCPVVRSVSPVNGLCPVIRKHLLVKLNPTIPENVYAKDKNNEQITEKPCVNEISTLNENFQSENTAEVWDKLRKSCKTKSKTPWQDSLANGFFLKTLEVEKKSTSCDDKNRNVSRWNLQRCKCKDLRDTNKNEGRLDEMIDTDEECDSPCLCPKYFISKSGLVFGSLEEKQCFDDKMEKMDEVFKSELITIKEQHERLREDMIPKLPDNDLWSEK